mmetsp:Transcript_11298/g.18393  ORF Transcript_11298/g.18393 Transcript_11298/m.18393 type:complete len:341 (-) Transcript_11298:69-1091(-)|eukprot:CAMPEP_0114416762 /NCGR_PEP_ID=MMETSP0103-20121206/2602_1 /TAXON_ID=37642 ORGANISM="Paraphysomonas imperforata, Strain PA2" /NCGR_SAMPLE_ID=MMETSP0103 /ASSEMBLY_ACC=CAM_ASM_000201 /LENGTH=340 /DNA_ID=CAMNT_0001585007 /DNA_START=100 /DNA_END=1122 /DNA_ORIENTATION=+
MGERKVLNRYVPPDFDPKIIPKFKRDKDKPTEVRTMLPFSMRCETCGEYMGRGKKFNSRKEYCKGEDYMGIRRWRFLVKCCVCNAEISFKTDPKSTDYAIEYGAVRNFEVWKDNDAAVEEDEKAREQEDQDAMKSLENRTLDSKLEMDVLDTLDEIKAMNQRHERVDTESILKLREEKAAEATRQAAGGLTDSDEALVKAARFKQLQPKTLSDDEDEDSSGRSELTSKGGTQSIDIFRTVQSQLAAGQKQTAPATAPTVIIKKKKRKAPPSASQAVVPKSGARDTNNEKSSNGVLNNDMSSGGGVVAKKAKADASGGSSGGGGGALGGLMMGYGSSSDDE